MSTTSDERGKKDGVRPLHSTSIHQTMIISGTILAAMETKIKHIDCFQMSHNLAEENKYIKSTAMDPNGLHCLVFMPWCAPLHRGSGIALRLTW